MDAIEKEVQRVAAKVPVLYPNEASTSKRTATKKTAAQGAPPSASVSESLDGLLADLQTIRSTLVTSSPSPSPAVMAAEAKSALAKSQKSIADRHKEVYNALSKLGKAYDKKFPTPIDGISDPDLFMGSDAQRSLEAVVLDHLLRMGEWDAAQQLAQVSRRGAAARSVAHIRSDRWPQFPLLQESELPLPPSEIYRQLESISQALEAGFLEPAIGWAEANRHFLKERSSDLEFALHRSQFLRIATGRATALADIDTADTAPIVDDPDGEHTPTAARESCPRDRAIAYGREHFRTHLKTHLVQVQSLFTFALFPSITSPIDPNADITSQAQYIQALRNQVHPAYYDYLDDKQMHSPYLVPLFRADFSALHGLAKDAPLSTAVEVGASGALMKIMKVRKVMKTRGTEWSQADELPVSTCVWIHVLRTQSCSRLPRRCRSTSHYQRTYTSTRRSPAPSARNRRPKTTRR